MATGIRRLHSKGCPAKDGGRCNYRAGWEAAVYSHRDEKRIYRTFKTKAEAVSWRADAKRSIDHGTLRAPGRQTLAQAAERWLSQIESGAIKNRDGSRYKPATLRGYRQALADYVLPELGAERFAQITTADIQSLVDRWEADGQEPATTRNAVKPLQALYRRAKARGVVVQNPTADLELPAPQHERAEIVAPTVAAELVELAPAQDRALWAAALYAGLRYGELRALRWAAVDLGAGQIQVIESWDPKAGPIAPKTKTSRRTIPISGALRDHLLDHRLAQDQPEPGALVFPAESGQPFAANVIYRRADKAWRRAELKALDDRELAELAARTERCAGGKRDDQIRAVMKDKALSIPERRLRLHQARHTCASFWIASGLDPKTVSAYMGHSSITVTYDLYGHLIPGSMEDDRRKMDAYLERADTAARIRAISDTDSV